MEAIKCNKMPVCAVVFVFTAVVLYCGTYSATAKGAGFEFHEQRLEAPFEITHRLIPAELLTNPGRELLVLGVDDQQRKHLALYAQPMQLDRSVSSSQYQLVSSFALPTDIYLFDVSKPLDDVLSSVVFLSHKTLYRLIPEAMKNTRKPPPSAVLAAVADIDSLASQGVAPYLRRAELLRQIDNNPRPDTLIDGLHGLTLIMNLGMDNRRLNLPIKPHMLLESEGVAYSGARVFFVDSNFDGRKDLLRALDGRLQVFLQRVDGSFSALAKDILLPHSTHARPWWYQRDAWGEEPNQGDMAYRDLEYLLDINADGIADLVVRYAKTSGVLDRVNDYEIYYGANSDSQLRFTSDVDGLISGDGTLAGLEFVDIDSDGRLELTVAGFDIGVSQIIRALIAGSVDEDVYVYRMDSSDRFPAKANFASSVKMTFSLTSAQRGDPVIKLLDLNGDGHSELLLSAGSRGVRIYTGRSGSSPFVRRSTKMRLSLPREGRLLVGDDLNGDGRDDIVFNFGRRDDSATPSQFIVLISAPG